MEKKPKKYIIDVAPLTRIPLYKSQSFSYLWDEKISPGSLVSIPLFRRNLEGIVLRSRTDFYRLGNIYPDTKKPSLMEKFKPVAKNSDTNFGVGVELKKIGRIIEENFLSEKQIRLAEFISDYYFSPLGIVLKSFVPKRTKARIKKQEIPTKKLLKKITLTKEQLSSIRSITENYKLTTKNYLLYGPSGSGKTEVYIHSILEIQKRNPKKQFLILVPELTLTPQALERYGQYFKIEEIAVLTSDLSKGQFFANWQKIRSGEAKIIIGTRMAVFAPFQKLGLVVIDEEQDISYKQWDMSPRYDARTVAQKLSEIYTCPIVFGSATPRIEDYHQAVQKKLKLLSLPPLKIPNKKTTLPDIILVDMRRERWEKNYSAISKKLRSDIAYVLRHKKQALIFLNRQGKSAFSICEKCKEVLRCPNCDRALIYSNSGDYRCLHCSYKTSIFPKCSQCGNLSFKNLGMGTQKIEKELQELFPAAKIIRADQENTKKRGSAEEIYREFEKGAADILIGTQMISKGWDLPNVALVGIIDIDNMLSIPDYSTNEKVFSLAVQVAGRTNRPLADFPGIVIIQTFQGENRIIQLTAKRDFSSFYQWEIKDREALFLPPFSKIIKLIYQDSRLPNVQKETERVFELLGEIFLEKTKIAEISPPHDCLVSKIRGRSRKQIIIKLPLNFSNKKLDNTLKKLPSGWIIDVNQITIIKKFSI